MKVSELFEAAQGSPGQGGKLARGAYNKPTYSDRGLIQGSVPDWLKGMGVSMDDVHSAYGKVKASPEYKAILKLGVKDMSSEREQKNGTLNFIGFIETDRPGRKQRIRYKVLANGKIDVVAANDWHRSPRSSPKPTVNPSDPVRTVFKTMTNALSRLHELLSDKEIIKEGFEALEEAAMKDVKPILAKLAKSAGVSERMLNVIMLGGDTGTGRASVEGALHKMEKDGYDSAGAWEENKAWFKKHGITKTEFNAIVKASE
jgi:hypothetical protein